jgi:hypothetical protein
MVKMPASSPGICWSEPNTHFSGLALLGSRNVLVVSIKMRLSDCRKPSWWCSTEMIVPTLGKGPLPGRSTFFITPLSMRPYLGNGSSGVMSTYSPGGSPMSYSSKMGPTIGPSLFFFFFFFFFFLSPLKLIISTSFISSSLEYGGTTISCSGRLSSLSLPLLARGGGLLFST